MPQGCDFTCNNKDCHGYEKTIVIHGVWPTKSINQSIAEAGNDPERKAALTQRKADGRITALFVYPQDVGREPVGYRIQLYCPSCLVVEDTDCDNRDKVLELFRSPSSCPKCGSCRFSLKTATELGLRCPCCQEKMEGFFWFTKS